MNNEIKNYVNKYIKDYCKGKNISQKQYSLYPLYMHLNGFSHTIGFTNKKANGEYISDYNSVGYSGYMSECEQNIWGYENEYQKELAKDILSKFGHSQYQNNAKEILF